MSDQQQIIKLLCASLVSKLSLKIGNKHEPIDVATFVSNLFKLLRSDSYQKHLSSGPFIIALDEDSVGTGSNIFSSNLLNEFFVNGQVKICNILNIDINGNVIAGTVNNLIIKNIAYLNDEYSASNLIFFFIESNSLDVIQNCITFKCIPDIFSLKETRAYKNQLPISEYRILIDNHYNAEIVGQRGFTYWANKDKRLLVPSPEVNFRKRLGAYLDLYISDGLVDQECLNANTADRNDIRVSTTIENNMYIIEVKWIGKCASKTQYDGRNAHSRANSGIRQLELYIKTEARCTRGILVVYDGRQNNEDIIWNPDKSGWHKVIDQNPFILYLDSLSASVKAGIAVKSKKTKK